MNEDNETLQCPECPLGELEVTETRRHLHCAVCGHYENIPEDSDYE
jgi:hypothetical protein